MTPRRAAERVLMATGIGGQGVQLAARVVALAAMAEGREVMLFGSYGGMMRGGNTAATMAIGDGPIELPPVAPDAWAALVLHHEFLDAVAVKLRPASVAFINASVVPPTALDHVGCGVMAVPATEVAQQLGNPLGAAMVLVGAMSAATGLVGLDALVEVVPDALPPYRRDHVSGNQAALRAGFARTDRLVVPAWPQQSVVA